jgi:hypothetical protein
MNVNLQLGYAQPSACELFSIILRERHAVLVNLDYT